MSEMPESKIRIDISSRLGAARAGPVPPDTLRTHEVILYAIAGTPSLRESLYLKGGTLMTLVYDSPRRTTDMDFSYAPFGNPDDDTEDRLKSNFNDALTRTAARLGFADLVIRVQSVRHNPRTFPAGQSPALELRIAYARRDTRQEARLNDGNASDVIPLDISFNEWIGAPQELQISDEDSLLSYSMVDLVSEKYRALLQQGVRERNRRQDVYDLEFLLRHYRDELNYLQPEIFKAFIEKCASRDLSPCPESINEPVIRERASADWNTLALDLGPDEPLPDFDLCFESVASFYRLLPWPASGQSN